jgi:hypothetical protein
MADSDSAHPGSSPGLPAKFRKAANSPTRLREPVAEAGIVTASVTVPANRTGLLFLSAEYDSEGEAVVNTVTVRIRVKLHGKYPYLPAVWSGNGRLKPKAALVNGNERKVEGQSYLRFTEDGTRRPRLVGADAAEAAAAAEREEVALKAKAAGFAITEDSKSQRIKLADAMAVNAEKHQESEFPSHRM